MRAGSAAQARAAVSGGGRRGAVRDPHWDNVRYLSGTLVVIGHAVEELRYADGVLWLYLATWALRLPVFALVCGCFSSAEPPTAREIRRLVESVAVPYLVFSVLHAAQIRLLTGAWDFSLGDPAWGLWFLLSLIFWRVALPYVALLPHPFLASVLAALAVGYFDEFGTEFSAARTVAFFPFFVLGWKISRGDLNAFFTARRARPVSGLVVAGSMACMWFLRDDVRLAWLPMRGPYGSEGEVFGAAGAWLVRAALIALGATVAVCFVHLVPRRRIPVVTYLGAGGMYIYLLHIFFIRAARHHGLHEHADHWHGHVAVIAGAALLAAALASPPVRRLARPLVQPRIARLGGQSGCAGERSTEWERGNR
ncbi:acyltransferase family protein [Streptomyces marincola]|uniref:acyltransferase family protein n=1 Tax=Streptomyces marincola TaxID=2878388 RepID=UPI001CF23791|nr:hypothetical protein [Streptomyces marincola]UCM89758.1 hypothetical protein LC193_18370 [Streptomyces marincola]